MKKFYVIIIAVLFASDAQSQCAMAWSPVVCDTTCNQIIYVNASNKGMTYHAFVDGIYKSTFTHWDSIGSFCPGVYNVFITDSAGCNFSNTVTIDTVLPISISFTTQQPSCYSCTDGSITATVTGGTSTFGYALSWSNGVYNSSTINNLAPGVYCLGVSDTNFCYATLCDTLGSQTGFSLITGQIFLDLDTNGMKNGLEPGANNIQVLANPGGYSAWTSGLGNYSIYVPNGNYNISAILPNNWVQTSSPTSYNLNLIDTILNGNNFGLLPDAAISSAQLSITAGIPRCSWQSFYNLSYNNTSTMFVDTEIQLNLDQQVSFISATPTPTNISGNIYTWSFNNTYPLQYQNINVIVQMPPTPGTILNNVAIINLFDNLNNIFTDTVYKTQTVTCSWDPNDKLALPEGFGAQNIVPLNTIGDYTIRFQNTGTDTAFVVVIKDTLNSLLDLSTFKLLASSHEVNTEMSQDGVLTFAFNNILLPDSNINEPGSRGFIRYIIKPVTPIADPTVITNTAYIYFDQNPAVITNTTSTTYSDNLLSITELNGTGIIKVYPNPFSNEVIIQFEKNVNVKSDLYDYSGRIINNYLIKNSGSFVIKRQEMKPGIYLLKLTSDEGVSTLKLIVK